MLTSAGVKWLLLAAVLAVGGYVGLPPKSLWPYGIHKPWAMEWFEAEAPDGTKVSSEDCEGRPVLLVTWAAWCPYMPDNLREVERIKLRYSGSDACIVPVSIDKEKPSAWQFARSQSLLEPYYWGYYGLSAMYWGHAVPHAFVFDRSGSLVLSEDTRQGGYDGVMTALDTVVHDGVTIDSPAPTAPGHAPKPMPEEIESAETAERVGSLWRAGDLDGIDSLAKDWRGRRARTAMDVWKEWTLYNQLVLDANASEASDSDFESRINYFMGWIANHPTSVVARMALARQWYQYAWRARGEGYADSVTAAGYAKFKERLDIARSLLEQVEAMPDKTPVVYYTMIGLARSQDWPEAKRDELFRKAIAFEPDYFPFYENHAKNFEPRWGGTYAAMRTFIERSADGRGDGRGNELYARLVWETIEDSGSDSVNPFLLGFSWPRVLAGYRSLIARDPGPAWRLECARMASLAGDKAVAREMFASEGVRYAPWLWRDHDGFARARRWAFPRLSIWQRLAALIGFGGIA
jgi:hypothetical protein